MPRIKEVVQSLERILVEKQQIGRKEARAVSELRRVLAGIGYSVVPFVKRGRRSGSRTGGAVTSADHASKRLPCPHCGRRFARPLHLGRHVSAMHRRKKRRRGKSGKAKK